MISRFNPHIRKSLRNVCIAHSPIASSGSGGGGTTITRQIHIQQSTSAVQACEALQTTYDLYNTTKITTVPPIMAPNRFTPLIPSSSSLLSSSNLCTTNYHKIQIRQMGIRTKAKNRTPHNKNKKKKEIIPPINAELIRMLSKKHKNADPESIQVRCTIDQGWEAEPIIEVMSLKDAVSESVEREMDLIGINLKQEIPVVKCITFYKFKKMLKKKGQNGSAGVKAMKQFQFKAGIEDHDLERKVRNMVSYLVKGHSCQVTISVKRRNLMADRNAVQNFMTRLEEIVGEDGNPQSKIKLNEQRNRGSVLFQPNSSRTKN